MGNYAKLEKERAEDETATRTQQAANGSAYDAAKGTKRKVSDSPINGGLANQFLVPCKPPALAFFVKFGAFIEFKKRILHLEMAAADLVSNPTIKVSIGTKMPPPPTPPTVPHADPRNPIMVARTLRQLNFNS
nr:hypothetical protein Iba_scaffold10327CG0040 [Ipomoea batatas]